MSQYRIVYSDELYHHGILGQKWGVRRYQPYPDGYRGNGKFVGSPEDAKKITKIAKSNVRSAYTNMNQAARKLDDKSFSEAKKHLDESKMILGEKTVNRLLAEEKLKSMALKTALTVGLPTIGMAAAGPFLDLPATIFTTIGQTGVLIKIARASA